MAGIQQVMHFIILIQLPPPALGSGTGRKLKKSGNIFFVSDEVNRMIRGILITVLALGVAGTAFWGYQEHRDKNAVLLNAENSYQRAFHDLSFQMDLLHDK